MSQVHFIVHNDKQILLMDFSNAHSVSEINETIEKVKKIVAIHQPQSLLGLLDLSGMKIDKGRIKIIKGMAAHNRPYIKFIALVGLGFLRSILFSMMLRLTGRKNHRVFETRENALDWLGEK